MDTLEELLQWLMNENGSVGILGIPLLVVICPDFEMPPIPLLPEE